MGSPPGCALVEAEQAARGNGAAFRLAAVSQGERAFDERVQHGEDRALQRRGRQHGAP